MASLTDLARELTAARDALVRTVDPATRPVLAKGPSGKVDLRAYREALTAWEAAAAAAHLRFDRARAAQQHALRQHKTQLEGNAHA